VFLDIHIVSELCFSTRVEGAGSLARNPSDISRHVQSSTHRYCRWKSEFFLQKMQRDALPYSRPDTAAEEGPSPIDIDDHDSADIDADEGATSVKTEYGKTVNDAEQEGVVTWTDAQIEESRSVNDDAGDAVEDDVEPRCIEDEPNTAKIKTEAILERHHDTKFARDDQSMNMHISDEERIDTIAQEWLSLQYGGRPGTIKADGVALPIVFSH